MGWCSATGIFDSVLDAGLPYITDKAAQERFVYLVAVPLWDGDWDCEGDSDYYEKFKHILDAGECSDKPWASDPAVVEKFPLVKAYRKTYVTPALRWTGHNFDALVGFCEGDYAWGLANGVEVAGNVGPCPYNTGVHVYDYLHRVWIPFAVGDHIAEGLFGEHYPIEAQALKATYVEVDLT